MNNPIQFDNLQEITNNDEYFHLNPSDVPRPKYNEGANQDTYLNPSLSNQMNDNLVRGDFSSNFSKGEMKKKRRSKYEQNGRIFECPICHKSYLGSSSLSLHQMTKHKGMISVERKRRSKNCQIIEKKYNKFPQNIPISQPPQISQTPTNTIQNGKQNSSISTPIIFGFYEIYNTFLKESYNYEEYYLHPLYKKLFEFHINNIQTIEYDNQTLLLCPIPPINFAENTKLIFTITNPFDQYSSYKKVRDDRPGSSQINCDNTFAMYLNNSSQKFKYSSYEKIMEFVLLFRELLNKNGRKLLAKKLETHPELERIFGKVKYGSQSFCEEHNAEIAPEICNEFVMKYVAETKSRLSREESIQLTKIFCEWLFKQGFTKIKIMQETN